MHIALPHQSNKTQSGLVAITSLLIISVMVLSVAISISLLGLGSAQNSLSYKKGVEALKIAESCIEEGLLRLRDDGNYSGGTLQVEAGSCTIVVSDVGSNRTLDVTGQVPGPPMYERSIQVTVRRMGTSINLLTWQEQ